MLNIALSIVDTQTEINATWIDGSETTTWIFPNEIIIAIGESLAVMYEGPTPLVTVYECAWSSAC